MKKWIRFLVTRKFFGSLLEILITLVWLLKLRVIWKYRNIDNFAESELTENSINQKAIHISCRNLLMPGFSGVNVWVENISRAISKDFSVTIFCQGRNLFSEKILYKDSVTIVAVPLLKYLRLNVLPLYTAWNLAIQNQIQNNTDIQVLIAPISGIETYGIKPNNRLQVYTLLVTDERTHRYPSLTLEEFQKIDHFDPRTREIIAREQSILSLTSGRFLADSYSIISYLENMNKIQIRDRSTLLPINLQIDECNSSNKENIFFFVGRSDLRKDLLTLLKAWCLVSFLLPDWKLVVATSGGDDVQAFHQVSDLASGPNGVQLLVDVSDDVKHEFFSKSRIVVCPSRFESFGIVALEAMIHGCATISSKVGGLPEVLGDCGIFFQVGSEIDLATKMLTLALDTDEIKFLGQKSQERALKDFSDEEVRKIFLKLFND